ncbi:restriction endonuclease [Thermopolyspora sp. NPDC052614]|uniref:restriction endonuclease n=1 Tax=Thermopolyspora sp. NPDC052614 TaxID=3155682 RepID=UPI003441C89F
MARRRKPVKRRSRARKGGAEWVLWLFAIAAVALIAKWLLNVVVANWPVLLSITLLVVVGLVCAVVLRARVIRARQEKWLEDNARLERADRLSPDDFEVLVERLLLREGFRDVRRLGGSGDGGIDVMGRAPTGEPFAIQCKRWRSSVGSPVIRDLLGALHAHPGHRGVLVTTASITAPARQYAEGTGLILIDRALLGDWLAGAMTLAPRPRPGLTRRPWTRRRA